MNFKQGVFVLIMVTQFGFNADRVFAGTINNATIIVNGQLETFDLDPANNWYTFTLNSSGNVLFSGQVSTGGSACFYIFDSSLSEETRRCTLSAVTLLEAGDYFLQVFSSSGAGTFTFTSTFLKPECGAPSPDYTAGYNAGEQNADFVVIPVPIKAK